MEVEKGKKSVKTAIATSTLLAFSCLVSARKRPFSTPFVRPEPRGPLLWELQRFGERIRSAEEVEIDGRNKKRKRSSSRLEGKR